MRQFLSLGRVISGLIVLALPGLAQAEPYRLVSGDKVEIYQAGIEDTVTTVVDSDGQVRLRGLGGVTVRGLTLDEAEDSIESEMERLGLYVDPRVSLVAVSYAPIIVAGDVTRPGSFEYVPGMTVASALALSGGSDTPGSNKTDVVRLRTQAESDLDVGNLEIAEAVVEEARHAAMLGGADAKIEVTPAMQARIPSPSTAGLDGMIADATALLETERERGAQLMKFWQNEIETADSQREIYDQRIAVYEEIAARSQETLAAARQLSERGLQTATRLADAESRAADAQSRVLELEAARMSAARAKSVAQREMVQYQAGLKEDAIAGRRKAATEIERLVYNYQRNQKLLVALSGADSGSIITTDTDTLILSFQLQSPRDNRPRNDQITLSTPILPGDNLIVRVEAFTAAN